MNGSSVKVFAELGDLPTACPGDGSPLEPATGRAPTQRFASVYRSCLRCAFVAVWHPPEPVASKAAPS